MEIVKGKVSWIDIEDPGENDLRVLEKKFHFHSAILKELKEPSARTRVESYAGYLYLVYHFPVYDVREKISRRSEVDVLITKNAVITVHYGASVPLHDIRRELSSKAKRDEILESSLRLGYELIKGLLNFNQRQLRHVRDKVDKVADLLFEDREKEVLKQLSYLKRDISEYRIIVKSEEHLLRSLSEHGVAFWGPQSRMYTNDLIGEYLKLANQLEAYREAVIDFESTNSQLMNVKTNEAMKTLTLLAFLTFPLVLIATLFGMNTGGVPFTNNPQGFWIVVGIMILATFGMLAYFKKKGWI